MCSIHLTFGSYLVSHCTFEMKWEWKNKDRNSVLKQEMRGEQIEKRDSFTSKGNLLKLRPYHQNSYSIIWSPISSPISSAFPKQRHDSGHRGCSIFSPPFYFCFHFPSFTSWQKQTHTPGHRLMENDIIKGSLLKHWCIYRAGIHRLTSTTERQDFLLFK